MPKFPNNQELCVTYTCENGNVYYITRHIIDSTKFTSWRTKGKDIEKIKTNSDPRNLEKDFK